MGDQSVNQWKIEPHKKYLWNITLDADAAY